MAYEVQRIRMEPQLTAVVCGRVPSDGIGEFIVGALREVIEVLNQQGVAPSGPPFTRYHTMAADSADATASTTGAGGDGANAARADAGRQGAAGQGAFEVAFGFPVPGPITPAGRVEAATLPGGETILVMHRGAYDQLSHAFAAAERWLAENEWEATGAPWEAYLDGPEVEQPRTIVHVPVRPC